jgi:hypothetical protein
MLTVSIPDEIDKQLSSITNDKEGFIINVVKQKIATKKNISSEELAKEYRDSIEENKLIAEDYKYSDVENLDDY